MTVCFEGLIPSVPLSRICDDDYNPSRRASFPRFSMREILELSSLECGTMVGSVEEDVTGVRNHVWFRGRGLSAGPRLG